ncbi:MAG: hypothetical protein RL367_1111, partial [Pseudomonadota bacterium]|jgi:hypothetical protein
LPIDLQVHDHIIVANSGWFSMQEHGLMAQTEGAAVGSTNQRNSDCVSVGAMSRN